MDQEEFLSDVEWLSGTLGSIGNGEACDGSEVIACQVLNDIAVLVAVQIAVAEGDDAAGIHRGGEFEVELCVGGIDLGEDDGDSGSVFFDGPTAVGGCGCCDGLREVKGEGLSIDVGVGDGGCLGVPVGVGNGCRE